MENVHYKYYQLGSTSTRQTIILYYHTSNHDISYKRGPRTIGREASNILVPKLSLPPNQIDTTI